ncbi:DHRS11.2 family protein [Megaselia abdita]
MSSIDRWRNKAAVVTGASSGIGAACAIDLVKSGMIVVALARREHRLNDLKNKLPEELRGRIHTIKCDVSKESDVIKAFKWVDENLDGTHVLVNSAGIFNQLELTGKHCTPKIQQSIDTDVMGAVYSVREAFNQMKNRKIDGHIVLINSIAGHYIPRSPFGSTNIYTAVKYATTAMTETYRQEFSKALTNIKITSVSPGAMDSEIVPNKLFDMVEYTTLKPEDVSSAVVYCISTPPNVQIHELTIKPLHEKF